MNHELVDIFLSIASVAAVLIGGLGPYLLSRRDRRLQALEKVSDSTKGAVDHVQGFLAGKFPYFQRYHE